MYIYLYTYSCAQWMGADGATVRGFMLPGFQWVRTPISDPQTLAQPPISLPQ